MQADDSLWQMKVDDSLWQMKVDDSQHASPPVNRILHHEAGLPPHLALARLGILLLPPPPPVPKHQRMLPPPPFLAHLLLARMAGLYAVPPLLPLPHPPASSCEKVWKAFWAESLLVC